LELSTQAINGWTTGILVDYLDLTLSVIAQRAAPL